MQAKCIVISKCCPPSLAVTEVLMVGVLVVVKILWPADIASFWFFFSVSKSDCHYFHTFFLCIKSALDVLMFDLRAHVSMLKQLVICGVCFHFTWERTTCPHLKYSFQSQSPRAALKTADSATNYHKVDFSILRSIHRLPYSPARPFQVATSSHTQLIKVCCAAPWEVEKTGCVHNQASWEIWR